MACSHITRDPPEMQSNRSYLRDEAATEDFGRCLALATSEADSKGQRRTSGGLIELRGELGAGKTTLVRGLMRGYGYEGAVKSPTYTLVEPYELVFGNIYHFDLYRLGHPEELEFLGVSEYFEAPSLCLVEWPEQGRGLLPVFDLRVSLENESDSGSGGRWIYWQALTQQGRQIAERLVKLRQNCTY